MSDVEWQHAEVHGLCVVCGCAWPCAIWVEDREEYDSRLDVCSLCGLPVPKGEVCRRFDYHRGADQ